MHVQPQDALPKIMFARYYGSNVGRFLSVDPVSGNTQDPQAWNGYVYADNSPTIGIDPDGRETTVVVVGPGDVSDPKSLFGHAAYYSTNGDDAGGVSWGTPVQFDDTGLDGFVQKYEAQGRKVRLFAIETTPAQDQQLIDLSSRPESDLVPSEGSMLSRNCARACSVALEEAGVVTPGTGLGEDQFGIATPTQLGADLVKSGVGVEVNPDPVSEDTPEQTQAKADKPHAGRTKY